MAERIKWGVLGNATIARVCVIPTIQKSRNSAIHALATRSPSQARELVAKHNIQRLYGGYDACSVILRSMWSTFHSPTTFTISGP